MKALKRIFSEYPGQVAGVILEPVGVVAPESGFLGEVQALCRREGSLLIFDEVITGFRLARGGAQEYFGVVPDLACFGKAMANGYPLSAVVGPQRDHEDLRGDFFFFHLWRRSPFSGRRPGDNDGDRGKRSHCTSLGTGAKTAWMAPVCWRGSWL